MPKYAGLFFVGALAPWPVPFAGPAQLERLAGREWRLEEFRSHEKIVELVPSEPYTVRFLREGRMEGQAGCNTYDAEITLANGSIDVREFTSTEAACSPGSRSPEFLNAMRAAISIEVGEETVTIHSSIEEIELRFGPAPSRRRRRLSPASNPGWEDSASFGIARSGLGAPRAKCVG